MPPYGDPYAPEPLYPSSKRGPEWGYSRYPARNDVDHEDHGAWHHDVAIETPFHDGHHHDAHYEHEDHYVDHHDAPHHGHDSWHHDVVI